MFKGFGFFDKNSKKIRSDNLSFKKVKKKLNQKEQSRDLALDCSE